MIVWNPKGADDTLFARLREHYSDEQIVELGYFIAITFGQQRWIKTLGIGHGEFLDLTAAGLAPEAHRVSPAAEQVPAPPLPGAEAHRVSPTTAQVPAPPWTGEARS